MRQLPCDCASIAHAALLLLGALQHTFAGADPDGPRAQNHMTLHAFPEAPFKLNNWTAKGYQCVLDKTPDRMLDIQARPECCGFWAPQTLKPCDHAACMYATGCAAAGLATARVMHAAYRCHFYSNFGKSTSFPGIGTCSQCMPRVSRLTSGERWRADGGQPDDGRPADAHRAADARVPPAGRLPQRVLAHAGAPPQKS